MKTIQPVECKCVLPTLPPAAAVTWLVAIV